MTLIDAQGVGTKAEPVIGCDGVRLGSAPGSTWKLQHPRIGPRGVPRGRARHGRLPRGAALYCALHMGRPRLPPGALPAQGRRASSTLRSPFTATSPRSGAPWTATRPRCSATSDRPANRCSNCYDSEGVEALFHGRPRRRSSNGPAVAPTLLGDAAHPMVQYLAQGACTACEDAVTLGFALRREGGDGPARLRCTSARASRALRAWCCRRARWAH